MAQITLKQAVDLQGVIVTRINELIGERNSVAFVKALKGEEYEVPVRKFEDITKEISEAREDLRTLSNLIAEKNFKNKVTFEGKEYNVLEAIELAKQIRLEAKELKGFGNHQKQRMEDAWRSEVVTYVYAMYEPEQAKVQAQKLSARAFMLSSAIDTTNAKVKIDFEASEKYIGV